MPELVQEILKVVVGATVPILILLAGGQQLLNRYEAGKKQQEQEIELARFVRERQYGAVEELYNLFARFMELYRLINSRDTNLADTETRCELFDRVAEAESAIDSAILRIGCEFTSGNQAELEPLLGNLRQSVQLWRERIRDSQKLPFTHSEQTDYVRFKNAFAGTCAYMVHWIYQSLSPPEVQMKEAQELLKGAFSNKYGRKRSG